MEILCGDPAFMIDAAHNAQCSRALRDTLDKYFPGRERILIVGVVRDKDYLSIIDANLPQAAAVFTVTTESARAMGAGELADIIRGRGGALLAGRVWACGSPAEAAERAIALARGMRAGADADMDASPVICAFGSMYYIGSLRDYFGYKT
jgi:dihydrofolate synthase/folylpolyglutamate synthase